LACVLTRLLIKGHSVRSRTPTLKNKIQRINKILHYNVKHRLCGGRTVKWKAIL